MLTIIVFFVELYLTELFFLTGCLHSSAQTLDFQLYLENEYFLERDAHRYINIRKQQILGLGKPQIANY